MPTLKELWTKQTVNAKKILDYANKMKKQHPSDQDWKVIVKTAKKQYKEALEKLKKY